MSPQTETSRVDRRSLLKSAAITSVSAAVSAGYALSESGTASPTADTGTTAVHSGIAHASGIPLGGIGSGSIEIRPDGYFHDWLIFNSGAWAPEQPSSEQGGSPDMGPDALEFFIRCQKSGSPVQLRRLGTREDANDLYSLGFVKPVQAIQFDGKFPFATLNYVDESLPVQISGLAFSPIIPHESRLSGTPGFQVCFKIKNTSGTPVRVSLLGLLKNPLAWGEKSRALTNDFTNEEDTAFVRLGTNAEGSRKSTLGTMAFSVTGGRRSHIAGTYEAYLGNGTWRSMERFGSTHYSILHAYYRDGKLPSLSNEASLDSLLRIKSREDLAKLSGDDKAATLAKLRNDAFFREVIEKIEQVDHRLVQDEEPLTDFLWEASRMLNDLSGGEREKSSWGSCALESSIDLHPGEERDVRFALSWHFPNHLSSLGPNMGHQYENWFTDALEVNRFLVRNQSSLRRRVVNFAETMLSTNLPQDVAFAWGAQLTTLIKSSWWTKNGRFAIWEGLGCCGLHTTDITYQGSFPLIALYPDLQKGQILMGADYQRKDGRIPHFFAPDLLHVDNGFDRVDMNPQFVLMVCRDYVWTGDLAYVKRLWPKVMAAMQSTAQLDGSGEGIPDRDTRRNTYDQWDLDGSPAYICSLWIGALQSAIHLANALGENDTKDKWTDALNRAVSRFVSKLWNNDYFDLWATETDRDQCCMSDQLSGQWYTSIMGLGSAVPKDLVQKALASVAKNNFDSERGLVNATYPVGKAPRMKAYRNFQGAANWTGIEYANAALMIEIGDVETGLAVIRSVYDRYVRAGRLWNHVECGDHYYRAMSSWTTLLALTGFKWDAKSEMATIRPKVKDLVAPWFIPSGFGVLGLKGKRIEISCRSGELRLSALRVPSGFARCMLGSATIETKLDRDGEGVQLHFASPLVLREGDVASISS